jgi:hypothetical protein
MIRKATKLKQAGRITGIVGTPRQIQLGEKLVL